MYKYIIYTHLYSYIYIYTFTLIQICLAYIEVCDFLRVIIKLHTPRCAVDRRQLLSRREGFLSLRFANMARREVWLYADVLAVLSFHLFTIVVRSW